MTQDRPEIVRLPPQGVASLRVRVAREEIGPAMRAGLGEIARALVDRGVAAQAPWFTHHLHPTPSHFDFAICVPVAAPFEPAGRVRYSVVPAMLAARTIHAGPYDGLGDAWSAFCDRIDAHGMAMRPDLFERYAVGPEASDDPAAWRTILEKPLVEATSPAALN